MDYKFLAFKEIEKLFASELTVGEIFYTVLSPKLTKVEFKDKSKLLDISDKKWYEILEKTFEKEQL